MTKTSAVKKLVIPRLESRREFSSLSTLLITMLFALWEIGVPCSQDFPLLYLWVEHRDVSKQMLLSQDSNSHCRDASGQLCSSGIFHPHCNFSTVITCVLPWCTEWHLVSETGELKETEFSITKIKLIKNNKKKSNYKWYSILFTLTKIVSSFLSFLYWNAFFQLQIFHFIVSVRPLDPVTCWIPHYWNPIHVWLFQKSPIQNH